MLERLRRILETRYQVVRELGAGGMATVFLASDLKHQREVAIKVLRPDLAAGVGPERFLREIGIAAMLQHPHIVPVYDSGQADGLLYYVMPFVEGESLRDRLIREGPLQANDAARITREVADALGYAHRQGIVHRDIKPANILLSQGHAVVADFGIARALSPSTQDQLTQRGIAVGTPNYMSPEQALGESNIDGRTDVYALGVVLYEMLAGKPPFTGTTPQAVVGQVLSRPIPRLSRDPLRLQGVIERAMAKETEARFAAAEEFCSALDAVASGAGFRVAKRRRARVLVGVGIVVVIAGLAAAVLWSRGDRTDPRKSLIVFPFENKTGDASRDYLSEAAMNLLGLAAAHWQDLRVFDDERTASLLRRRRIHGVIDFEEARAMAREAGVGTMIIGDLRHDSDSLTVQAKVHDVRSGDRLTTIIGHAPWTADPRPLFDTLAARLLGTSGTLPGERPSVLAQTTTSLEAYLAYLAGTGALQRFQVDSALALLARAVALDSNFALAYIRLRDADGWAGARGNEERRNRYVLAAERHSASLPPRLRALVAFHRAYGEHDFQRGRGIARDMIRHDSTDVEAWYQLGEAHFHHGSQEYPHPDSLGNLGIALRVFQRTLALDSSYVLAYQHIIDALDSCAESEHWVCAADSAVYGPQQALIGRFGRVAVERWAADARNTRLETARAWVAAVPASPRPRQVLIGALYREGRFDDVLRQSAEMERLGWRTELAFLKAAALFRLGHAGEAANAVEEGLGGTRDSLALFVTGLHWSAPSLLLAGVGRLAAARRLNCALLNSVPVDSVNGPGNLRMAKADLARLSDALLTVEAGGSIIVADFREVIARLAQSDSIRSRHVTAAMGPTILAVYLTTRDTILLADLVMRGRGIPSDLQRVVSAELALARADTASARAQVDEYVRSSNVTFVTDGGVMRAFAWADLLARLGRPRDALAVYARIDSLDDGASHPGFLVRSWIWRGALHQRLNEGSEALQWYRRFIAAWQHADPELRPLVERARASVATTQDGSRPRR